MNYIGALTSSLFKTKDNNELFFPFGAFGRGYYITIDEKKRLQKILNRYYAIDFFVMIILVFVNAIFMLIASMLLFVINLLLIKNLTNKYTLSSEYISFREIVENIGKSWGIRFRIILYVIITVSVCQSAYILITNKITYELLFQSLIAIAAMCFISYMYKKIGDGVSL